jgi:hypothetical protein
LLYGSIKQLDTGWFLDHFGPFSVGGLESDQVDDGPT